MPDFEEYRRELHLHCYRLLGSYTDAEDVLQETLLAAWQGFDRFDGRASVRTWLYKIATNRCLNFRRERARRVRAAVPPFEPPEPTRYGEIVWLQPYPDGPEGDYQVKEAVRLAFVVGLQRLPPRQAAALVLRDVLDFSAAEVADMLGTTRTAVKGTLQRARATLAQPDAEIRPKPEARPEAEARSKAEAKAKAEADLVRRFADAFCAHDVDGLLELLTDDVWLAMPPAPHEYHGHQAVREFLQVSGEWRRERRTVLQPVRANGQPAFAVYLAEAGAARAYAGGVLVLTLRADRISGLTRFLDSVALAHSGLIQPSVPTPM